MHRWPILRLAWCLFGAAAGLALALYLVAATNSPLFLASLGGSTVFLFGLTRAHEHPLQPLCPCHRHVASGCGLVGGFSKAKASPGRHHLLTQSVVRRKHPVVTREVDPGRRHQRSKPGDKVERLKHDIRGAVNDNRSVETAGRMI
jgi:hypothetical protein